MSNVTQAQTDAVVARLKKLVEKDGGQSPALAEVRSAYAFFAACPEAMGLVLLEKAIEKVEKGG